MIGILGGTFDPIHNGHLHIATRVQSRLGLEQVQLMPCALPVHRDRPHALAAQRRAMIELALTGRPDFSVNSLEIDRQGPSYMVDSLREMRRRGDTALALLLGADAFNGFARWKQPREILDLAHLVVCIRPGVEVDSDMFSDHRINMPEQLMKWPAGAILVLEVDAIDCSSSAVRAALSAGDVPRQWLNPGVADYIENNHLYLGTGEYEN